MGGSISSIAELALLTTTISIDLDMKDGNYISPLYCAAFKDVSGDDAFDWNTVTTVQAKSANWHLDIQTIVTMPDITLDSDGNPITPGTEYRLRCGVSYPTLLAGAPATEQSFHSTLVKTPTTPGTCETGVKVNGVTVPQVLMNGQKTLTLSGVEWSNFHPAMLGMHAYEVPTPVPAMSTIEMKCCGGEECEFFFALYNCEACTGAKPAGLAQTLVLDGWDSGACSPQFGDGFKTTAFHKNVHALDGDVVMTYTAAHSEVMAMFGLEGSIHTPWCVKPHGPAAPGPGCGVRCPEL